MGSHDVWNSELVNGRHVVVWLTAEEGVSSMGSATTWVQSIAPMCSSDEVTDIVVMDPSNPREFRGWHTALRQARLAGRPPAPFFSLDEYRALHTSPESLARRTRIALVAVSGGVVVGAAEIGLPHHWDTETAAVDVAVLPDHRRRGTGTALWERSVEVATGRTTVECEVDVPADGTLQTSPGGAFGLAHGFASANAEDHFLLALPLDRALLESSTDPHGYQLVSWVGPCPADRIAAYAHLQTVMAADAPHGQLEREVRTVSTDDVRASERSLVQRGFTILSTMAVDEGGKPAAYSTMFVGGHDHEHVHQDDTLVARAHRGHGLGRALKLANHRELDIRYPNRRWIHTWTVQDNTPMQRVNRALGYQAVETTHELARPTQTPTRTVRN